MPWRARLRACAEFAIKFPKTWSMSVRWHKANALNFVELSIITNFSCGWQQSFWLSGFAVKTRKESHSDWRIVVFSLSFRMDMSAYSNILAFSTALAYRPIRNN